MRTSPHGRALLPHARRLPTLPHGRRGGLVLAADDAGRRLRAGPCAGPRDRPEVSRLRRLCDRGAGPDARAAVLGSGQGDVELALDHPLSGDLAPDGQVGPAEGLARPAGGPAAGLGGALAGGVEVHAIGLAQVGDEGRIGELAGEGLDHSVETQDQPAVADDQLHVGREERAQPRGLVGRDQLVGQLPPGADRILRRRHLGYAGFASRRLFR